MYLIFNYLFLVDMGAGHGFWGHLGATGGRWGTGGSTFSTNHPEKIVKTEFMPTIKNQLVFDHKLNRMGELYEEGKDLLFHLQVEDPAHRRMFDVLKEMRDLACVSIQDAYMPELDTTSTNQQLCFFAGIASGMNQAFKADPTLEKIYVQECDGQKGMYTPFFAALVKRLSQLKNQQ